jgi:enoyl-CoA hydratase/carnithine racemase
MTISYANLRTAAVLEFHAPPVNAIGLATLDELLDALRRAIADPQVSSLVISGGS